MRSLSLLLKRVPKSKPKRGNKDPVALLADIDPITYDYMQPNGIPSEVVEEAWNRDTEIYAATGDSDAESTIDLETEEASVSSLKRRKLPSYFYKREMK